METIRQQIVNKNLTALETILTANGFETEIGLNVSEWRTAPFSASELPAVVFRDLDEPQTQSSPRSPRVERQLHCQIEVVTADDTPMAFIRKALADIEKAIGIAASSGWDGLAGNTRPRVSRAIVEQNSNKVGGSTFEYYIDYPTVAFNSYASLAGDF